MTSKCILINVEDMIFFCLSKQSHGVTRILKRLFSVLLLHNKYFLYVRHISLM